VVLRVLVADRHAPDSDEVVLVRLRRLQMRVEKLDAEHGASAVPQMHVRRGRQPPAAGRHGLPLA